MSFGTDLYHIMNNDASINSEIDGGIYYENLPDNFDITKKWILYHFLKSEQIGCLTNKKVATYFDVNVVLITQSTADLVTITDLLVNYLNDEEYGSIIDVTFENDGHSFDKEKNIYVNVLEFKSLYV